jgi:2-keto-myo-inositol isomerase
MAKRRQPADEQGSSPEGMSMKICFNEATTMKNSTLEQDLFLCEQNNYDYIEIRLDQLRQYLKKHAAADLVHFFSQSSIKPYSLNAVEFITFRDPAGYRAVKDDLEFLCQIGQRINCPKVVVVPTFGVGSRTRSEIKNESVRVLRELAGLAAPYGIKLAYEFVGYPDCSVNTLGQCWDIVKEVDRDDVGLVLDCFHFHAMGSRFEDLRQVDPAKIFVFHIDDSEDLPVGALRDANRLWPGDGVIDFSRLSATLKEIGYSEMASVELFRPEYWNWQASAAIRTAKEKTEAVLRRYFT